MYASQSTRYSEQTPENPPRVVVNGWSVGLSVDNSALYLSFTADEAEIIGLALIAGAAEFRAAAAVKEAEEKKEAEAEEDEFPQLSEGSPPA